MLDNALFLYYNIVNFHNSVVGHCFNKGVITLEVSDNTDDDAQEKALRWERIKALRGIIKGDIDEKEERLKALDEKYLDINLEKLNSFL